MSNMHPLFDLWCVHAVQMPPWQAKPTAAAEYQQLVDNRAYPAAVATSIAATGKVSLLNGADVVTATLERLLPGEWWNDELVNYGMWLLQKRDAALHDKLELVPGGLHGLWDGMQAVSCHFFSSFFFYQLYFRNPNREVTYAAVRKWTTPSKLVAAGQAKHAEGVLSCSLLVAPCNLSQLHWVLVVADLDRRRILYLDPSGVSCSCLLWGVLPLNLLNAPNIILHVLELALYIRLPAHWALVSRTACIGSLATLDAGHNVV